MNLVERFLKYVSIDTQSDPTVETCPSTLKQKNLGEILVNELKEMGVENAFMDEHGYVYGLIKSNSKKDITPIGFIAHMDTSPDAPGDNVSPRIIKDYDGSPIILNEKLSMDPTHFEALKYVIGDDIIVTDGNTLLGADDKAGVAEIMTMVDIMTKAPFEHGDIYIGFTPDEEIGRGADLFNLDWFKAKFAYTMDGSLIGGIEFENFNAASATIDFVGKSIHPGSAKNKLVNAMHIAFEFHQMLPVFQNPAYTEGYEGFNHLSQINGSVEHAHMHYIIRNHHMTKFNEQKEDFKAITKYLNEKYGYEAVKLNITDSYFNMYEILKNDMMPVELAKKAIANNGLIPHSEAIRGGTDGARLTFMGLPCPNLGTGGFNFHGRYEFASINQMETAVDIMVEIIKLNSK
ncbi:tripeptide aminopeptidase [Acholeplasma morum]|uniref:peptidase T n=1 Tax=Paracholeplasma morum TaxID=264637 RepID=UPI00195C7778|nr:peptidase T [Paracholeplasma morum]MBM7452800.1 tripeptide aminopeptidase [Paracholeplasma morum]